MLLVLVGCEAAAPAALKTPPPVVATTPERFGGTVREALAAGPYTYFLLHVDEGDDRWVVVADREHRRARRLTVDTHGRQRSFVSRRLDRTFPELYFGSVHDSEEDPE